MIAKLAIVVVLVIIYNEYEVINMKRKLLLRYMIFLVGIFMMGLGISMNVKSGLGTTPISCVPLLLSKILPFSFGTMAFFFSIFFIFVEWLILRKNFKKEHYSQLIVTPFFGFFIDLGMFLLRDINLETYVDKMLILLLACLLIALGIYFQVIAKVLINSAEGLVYVIAVKTKVKFGNIKILFDGSLVVIAIIISLLAFGKIQDIGEGTIIVAIALGSLVKVYKRIFDWIGIDWLYK